MKKIYITPALQLFHINVGTSIAQIISASVAGEGINVDNTTTNGNASNALVKGQDNSYNVWDDDWSN